MLEHRFTLLTLLAALAVAACSEDSGTTAGPSATGGSGGKSGSGGSAASDASGLGGSGNSGWGGGGGDAAPDAPGSCAGVTCSGHGTCSVGDAGATCKCDSGYHAVGADCQVDQSCTGMDCGSCGTCKVVGGVASCECPTGYVWQGGKCSLSPNPCDTTTCASDEACVPEAHCQPLGACVKTCDCSNCGNCGPDNSDGKWNDMQEYCGNPNASPATMACTKPCPSGEGCIPYNPAICWPIEGCFSL